MLKRIRQFIRVATKVIAIVTVAVISSAGPAFARRRYVNVGPNYGGVFKGDGSLASVGSRAMNTVTVEAPAVSTVATVQPEQAPVDDRLQEQAKAVLTRIEFVAAENTIAPKRGQTLRRNLAQLLVNLSQDEPSIAYLLQHTTTKFVILHYPGSSAKQNASYKVSADTIVIKPNFCSYGLRHECWHAYTVMQNTGGQHPATVFPEIQQQTQDKHILRLIHRLLSPYDKSSKKAFQKAIDSAKAAVLRLEALLMKPESELDHKEQDELTLAYSVLADYEPSKMYSLPIPPHIVEKQIELHGSEAAFIDYLASGAFKPANLQYGFYLDRKSIVKLATGGWKVRGAFASDDSPRERALGFIRDRKMFWLATESGEYAAKGERLGIKKRIQYYEMDADFHGCGTKVVDTLLPTLATYHESSHHDVLENTSRAGEKQHRHEL